MSDEDAYTMEIKGLEKLLKALKGKPPTARIGILTGKASEDHDGSTNAEIGAAHEFGAPARGLPQRSFLRVPLAEKLNPELQKDGAFSKQQMESVLKEGTVLPWLKMVAIVAEKVVQDAFGSAGFGKWPAWSPEYENNTGMILVDTTQLRDSITSEVKE